MRLVDLTLTIPATEGGKKTAALRKVSVKQENGAGYTGTVYDFAHDSMVGTYVDFPGHIKETDDGTNADNYPIEKLFRVDATVIRLDKPDRSGAVTALELENACPGPVATGGLILNALGSKRFDEIEYRSVYLDRDAVAWIADTGIHLFVSDIYESQSLHGVFWNLFKAGISTVCSPINLDQLTTPRAKLTVLPVRFAGVTQLPCRVVAELIED